MARVRRAAGGRLAAPPQFARPVRRVLELRAVRRGESQTRGKQSHGLALRRPPDSALERPDAVNAHPGAFCESLL
ncbi:MAG: hypothetical protein NVS3B16_21950 [Vulcanimicrobiaceae bacterium]